MEEKHRGAHPKRLEWNDRAEAGRPSLVTEKCRHRSHRGGLEHRSERHPAAEHRGEVGDEPGRHDRLPAEIVKEIVLVAEVNAAKEALPGGPNLRQKHRHNTWRAGGLRERGGEANG